MALAEVTASFQRRLNTRQAVSPISKVLRLQCRGFANHVENDSTRSADLEQTDFAAANDKPSEDFDPVKRSRAFKKQLPSSGYGFRPPKYNRGPLNPHRAPKPSDPHSREFIPGPFSSPRLEQSYQDTFAPDLMTLAYQHRPPGYEAPVKSDRLRQWTGESPYYKNRPLRGPRGSSELRLLRKPITFNNIPELTRVTIHSMVKGAMTDSAHLAVASMALQAISNVRTRTDPVKASVAGFGLKAGSHVSATCDLYGEDMYHFLSKVIDVVMPKIKDYKGVKGSSGDGSGNLAFGFTPEQFALFPEIEFNYDAYPAKMMPGCHIVVHTSASTDRDARMLLSTIGIPFYGKLID